MTGKWKEKPAAWDWFFSFLLFFLNHSDESWTKLIGSNYFSLAGLMSVLWPNKSRPVQSTVPNAVVKEQLHRCTRKVPPEKAWPMSQSYKAQMHKSALHLHLRCRRLRRLNPAILFACNREGMKIPLWDTIKSQPRSINQSELQELCLRRIIFPCFIFFTLVQSLRRLLCKDVLDFFFFFNVLFSFLFSFAQCETALYERARLSRVFSCAGEGACLSRRTISRF